MNTRFEWDVALLGPLFLDYGLTGLDASPSHGTEVFAAAAGVSPGGIANLAVASARLGLRTSLAAPFGTDMFGEWCWSVLQDQEGIDLSSSQRREGYPTPVTVAIAEAGDRSMITYAPNIDDATRSLVPSLSARAMLTDLKSLDLADPSSWWRRAAAQGTLLFADIGWDSTEQWRQDDLAALASCHAFTPNEREAMAYTRTETPAEAARALAELVPLVIVTCGGDGVIAIDSARGEEVHVPAIDTQVVDPTGAGDVFGAALVRAHLDECELSDQVAFAALAAGIAVGRRGSALSAPGWADIARWWDRTRASGSPNVQERYAFLSSFIPAGPHQDPLPAPDSLQYPAPPRGIR